MSVQATKKPPEYLREARIKAGFANRGTATTKVPYSPETIGRHERGEIPFAPEDAVVYAKGYQRPDILLRYCSGCPVGEKTGKTVTDRPLPFATLRVSRMIEDAQAVADRLEQIAFDGEIDSEEREDFNKALQFLRKLDETISDIMLIGATQGMGKAAPVGAGSGCIGK